MPSWISGSRRPVPTHRSGACDPGYQPRVHHADARVQGIEACPGGAVSGAPGTRYRLDGGVAAREPDSSPLTSLARPARPPRCCAVRPGGAERSHRIGAAAGGQAGTVRLAAEHADRPLGGVLPCGPRDGRRYRGPYPETSRSWVIPRHETCPARYTVALYFSTPSRRKEG